MIYRTHTLAEFSSFSPINHGDDHLGGPHHRFLSRCEKLPATDNTNHLKKKKWNEMKISHRMWWSSITSDIAIDSVECRLFNRFTRAQKARVNRSPIYKSQLSTVIDCNRSNSNGLNIRFFYYSSFPTTIFLEWNFSPQKYHFSYHI